MFILFKSCTTAIRCSSAPRKIVWMLNDRWFSSVILRMSWENGRAGFNWKLSSNYLFYLFFFIYVNWKCWVFKTPLYVVTLIQAFWNPLHAEARSVTNFFKSSSIGSVNDINTFVIVSWIVFAKDRKVSFIFPGIGEITDGNKTEMIVCWQQVNKVKAVFVISTIISREQWSLHWIWNTVNYP